MGRTTQQRPSAAHRETSTDDEAVRPLPRRETRSTAGDPSPNLSRRTLIGLVSSGLAVGAAATTAAKLELWPGAEAAGATSSAGQAGDGAATAVRPALADAVVAARMPAAAAAPLVAVGSSPALAQAKLDYQNAATGKAPAADPSLAVKQPPTVLPKDQALHLARRAAWGPTPALVAEIRKVGSAAWVASQLAPGRIADPVCDRLIAQFDTLGMTPAQLKAMNNSRQQTDYFYAHTQLEQAAIARAAWSNRQLLEVTVDFLHSRLHVPAHFDKSRDALNHYDTTVIRKYAFGRFSDMVWAMITHPAMILYLANQNNT